MSRIAHELPFTFKGTFKGISCSEEASDGITASYIDLPNVFLVEHTTQTCFLSFILNISEIYVCYAQRQLTENNEKKVFVTLVFMKSISLHVLAA